MKDSIWQYVVSRPGSTRLPALMRILLGLTCLSKFGAMLRPRPDSTDIHLLVMIVFWPFAIALVLGLWSRLSAFMVGFILLVGYAGLGQFGPWRSAWVHHHTYILTVGTLLLCLTPCGRSLSMDRWWAIRQGKAQPERGELWGLNLIALQVACAYFFSGMDKSRWAFLSGAELERTLAELYFGSDPMPIPGWRQFMAFSAWTTVILEYGLAVGLWWAPARRYLIPVAIAFHFMLYIVLPVSTFTFTMCVLLMAFVDADAVDEFLERLMKT